MRSFTAAERRARLARRHFLASPATSMDDVVRDLVGLHATDPATPYLSLWARLPGFSVTDLDTALYERRSVVKHLAMRRTLWVIGADYLAQVQAAASDRVAGNEHRKLVADVQKAGLDTDGERWLRQRGSGGVAPSRRARPDERQAIAHGPARTGGHIRSGTRKTLGRRHSPFASGADRAVRAWRYRPRPERRHLDDITAQMGRGGGLADRPPVTPAHRKRHAHNWSRPGCAPSGLPL